MKLGSALVALSTLTAGITYAAVVDRVLLMGVFRVSTTLGCPLGPSDLNQIGLGADSPDCRNFYANTTYESIDVLSWSQYCQLTLFNTLDCSEGGIVSGLGCWSPPGGIKGYKATCPWKVW
ncbi:hypothetical protein B0T24DRAFT_643752 [Lasiosphaeria ovina]|uniref:Uncharacterized protein n=1 Tax=Lasiosphaeria ovina TaxID=92902 RepID=A0AAE0JS98_9PEZI|nr:hypothetical protein B0T24DRAFT_643752 [Lasiosphaeria ovina]